MRMTINRLKKILEERLANAERDIRFNRETEELRIEQKDTKKGVTVALAPVLAKWETRQEKAIDEVVYYVEEALKAMQSRKTLSGNENNIFPVVRSTSFPTETSEGSKMLTDDHTAETRIYYAIDLGNTYRLIDDKMMKSEQWDAKTIKEMAKFNLRSLPCPLKKDTVAGNDFYFLNTNDGYDASRILNDSLLKNMEAKAEGKLVISVPHQDVLIFADIRNDMGYDILAQMSMDFFTRGHVPITSLSFYYEEGRLEPIFIMTGNKPKGKE